MMTGNMAMLGSEIGAYRFAQNTQSVLVGGAANSCLDASILMQVSIRKNKKEKQNRDPVSNAHHFTITKKYHNKYTIHMYIHNIPQPTKVRQRGGNVHKWRDHARNRSPEETSGVQNKEMSMYPN